MTKPTLCFLGGTHAAHHLEAAARVKGFEMRAPEAADVIFFARDTPTDALGQRDLQTIREDVGDVRSLRHATLVLTSAVPPGFTRSLGIKRIFHQAETLRIKDAAERAAKPEMMIVGCDDPSCVLPPAYDAYLKSWACPVLLMTWEEAEFAKIAINSYLIAQVATTNMLAKLAWKARASWPVIADVLRHDKRIGAHAYLEPGKWEKSTHLMRDYATLCDIRRDIDSPWKREL